MNELQITNFNVTVKPAELKINNYEELKKQLTQLLEKYKNQVVTEDNIKAVKADRAKLRKIARELDDKRKDVRREYNKPYNDFKEQVDTLTGLVDEVIEPMDSAIKQKEELERQQRIDHVNDLINEMAPNYGIDPENVEPADSWSNKSLSEHKRVKDISDALKALQMQKTMYENGKKLIEQACKLNNFESSGWLNQLDQGQAANQIIDDITQARKDADKKAEQELKKEEALKAVKEAEEKSKQTTLDNGTVVNKETGEVVKPEEPTYSISIQTVGTKVQINDVIRYIKQQQIKYSFSKPVRRD